MTSVYLQTVIAPLLEYAHAVHHAIAAQTKSSVKTITFLFWTCYMVLKFASKGNEHVFWNNLGILIKSLQNIATWWQTFQTLIQNTRTVQNILKLFEKYYGASLWKSNH